MSAALPSVTCTSCRRGDDMWLQSQTRSACLVCSKVKLAQVHFRAAQYWLEFRSLILMRAVTRAEARVSRILLPHQSRTVLTAAYESEMIEALCSLTAGVAATVLMGIPGWMMFDGAPVQQLLCDVVGPMLPTCRLDVERIGSDGFYIASASRIGAVLAPSHKGHLISLSLGGQSVAWAVLPLAFGIAACDVGEVRRVMRCLTLPPPRRVRLYVPDQGELYAMADCHTSCFFCHLPLAAMRNVFANNVREVVATDPPPLSDWPDFAVAFVGLGIVSIPQIVVAPLHWLAIVVSQFLKYKWDVVSDYVRGRVGGCANLDLSAHAPAAVNGVKQQRHGISIKALTALLRDPSFSALLSSERIAAPRRAGVMPAPTVSERDLFDALKVLRFEDIGDTACCEAMQTIVDVFFASPSLACLWTRGCHAGLHIPRTLREYDLTLTDILEQNIEHSNQEADALCEQYAGDGVRVGQGLFRTALMLQAGWAVVTGVGRETAVRPYDPYRPETSTVMTVLS